MERGQNAITTARDDGSADEVVGLDTPCHGCGYNLRGLRPTARCPECAMPVALSVRGSLLRQANPRWLALLWVGTRLGMWAACGSILIWLRRIVMAWIAPAAPWLVVAIPVALLDWTAVWLLTTADPAGPAADHGRTARRVARGFLPVAIASSVINWSVVLRMVPTASVVRLEILERILALVAIPGRVAFFLCLRTLARRIPSQVEDRNLRKLTWMMVALDVCYNALIGIQVAARHWRLLDRATMLTISDATLLVVFGLLLFDVFYATALGRLGRNLARAEAAARDAWAAQASATP